MSWWGFAHVQGDASPLILRMLESTFFAECGPNTLSASGAFALNRLLVGAKPVRTSSTTFRKYEKPGNAETAKEDYHSVKPSNSVVMSLRLNAGSEPVRLSSRKFRNMCDQRRFKSACVSARSDQSLHCLQDRTLHPWLSKIGPVKILIRLYVMRPLFLKTMFYSIQENMPI